jgi:hypothetical protein
VFRLNQCIPELDVDYNVWEFLIRVTTYLQRSFKNIFNRTEKSDIVRREIGTNGKFS